MEVAETGIWEITGPEQVTWCLPLFFASAASSDARS